MKRKLYVKQMKMSDLQRNSNSSVQEVADQGESKISIKGQISAPERVILSNSIQTQGINPSKMCPPSLSSTSSISMYSTTPLPSPLASTGPEVSNKTPLPKVDVLIKSRAFQMSENSNVDLLGGSSRTPPKRESIKAEGHFSDQRKNEWKKESEIGAHSDLAALPAQQTYDMDYTTSSGYDLQDNCVEVINRESRDSSPVYHQMERPLLPMANPGIYSSHLTMTPTDYGNLEPHANGISDTLTNGNVLHETNDMMKIHDMEHYGSDSSSHNPHGDHGQRYNHIRVWEQENSAYADYAWHGEENHATSSDPEYVKATREDDEHVNEPTLTGNHRPKRNPGRASALGKASGGSVSTRRRRKRVQTPVQRSAANMRERRRMCHLNVAFDHLKDHLPHVKDKKKLSRIQTLKAAIYYIHLLQDSLNTSCVSEI